MAARSGTAVGKSDRRAQILDAATAIFVRYGFKKTSMDDVARAVGLSRQGLYLHFPNKADLFRKLVGNFNERVRDERRVVLAREDIDLETRLLDAFVVTHATEVGLEHFDELLDSARKLVGDALRVSEQLLVADVTRMLREESVAARWKHLGISAAELADLLAAASAGIKRRAKSPAEYRRRMSVAVRLICRPISGS